ncbi:hypothetical protein M422DRAFT_38534 [Sphaerobolus stellatus SS14]|uniref:Zn(2)-C6 fungal-type domain-containing protein n=1 Tax=Sphaerobolus stellatus (strain SS14) TaxID=990650 RepID=A0A0C9UK64_SPHS4|nr:hypothetical protein M422DRAFT_38534 [Sphaerobolus stellatus SS14]
MSPPATNPSPSAEDAKKETKRRRNQLSCAECRRLKVRCDRVFPCESCRKRGCAAICPDGALMTKGTRFVLANTEELHAKILEMSERIRQLENAISASSVAAEPHPLLREDLLLIKVPIEFKNDLNSPPKEATPEPIQKDPEPSTLLDAFGTLKIGADGHSRFFGQTARTEHFVKDENEHTQPEPDIPNYLPSDILHLSQAFPFGSSSFDFIAIQQLLDFVPPMEDGYNLVDIYFSNAAWMYQPCPRPQFDGEILKHVYENANDPKSISPHRLSLFFAVLSHAVLTDLNREPYSLYAEQLHHLSRASLAASPFLQEPTLPVIQSMVLIGFYLVLVNRKEAASMGWALQGLNCKMAEMLGLHRDLEYWDTEDRRSHGEARRTVFWELVCVEGWMSLGLGRPATLHFSQIDCKMPAASQAAMRNPELQCWHTWKHGLAPFVSQVLQKALDAATPTYEDILELDRNIHAYAFPVDVEALANGLPYQSSQPDSAGLTMQRWLAVQARYTVVLLLHRGFFAQALTEKADPMQSRFAPSVLATYRSACYIILALQNTYSQHPTLTCRFGLFWSNAFSASIALCLIVTRATKSSYAPFAFGQLDLAYDLFRRAAPQCVPAAKAFPILTRLRDKAHVAYAPYRNGQHPASLAAKKVSPMEHDDEELSILGGKTNIVAAPAPSTPPPPPGSMKYELAYPGSPGMVMQLPPTSHLDSVHPSLVQYLAQSPLPRAASIPNDQAYPNIHILQQSLPQDGHTYYPQTSSTYPPINPSSSSLAAAMPGYDRVRTNNSTSSYLNQRPEIHQPTPQSQYAAWQNYMEQLGLPY